MDRRIVLLSTVAVACSSAATPLAPGAPPAPDDGPAGVTDTTRFVDACSALNHPCTAESGPDCGKCQYRFAVPATCSAATPCDDLVLVWANFGCDADGV